MGEGTELGRVRGLGSAKHGAGHWITQRTTALGNLVLALWLFFSLMLMPDFGHATLVIWLAQPIVAVPMMLLLISIFWHVRLGLQVLIEDYVHEPAPLAVAIVILNFYVVGAGAFGVFTIAKIAFSGTPA